MARNIPVLLVATVLTFIYGRCLCHAWIPALIQGAITFVCVLIGGLTHQGLGQIIGILLSAVIIFFIYVLPVERRRTREEMEKALKTHVEMNEEDK